MLQTCLQLFQHSSRVRSFLSFLSISEMLSEVKLYSKCVNFNLSEICLIYLKGQNRLISSWKNWEERPLIEKNDGTTEDICSNIITQSLHILRGNPFEKLVLSERPLSLWSRAKTWSCRDRSLSSQFSGFQDDMSLFCPLR